MLADTQIFFLWSAYAALIYWLIPVDYSQLKKTWLILISVLFVYAYAFWAAVFVFWMCCICSIAMYCIFYCRRPIILTIAILLTSGPLLAQRFIFTELSLIFTLGITFATLRSIAIIMDVYTNRIRYAIQDIILCHFFLPLYTVGPIEGIKKFADNRFIKFEFVNIAFGLRRTCVGIFKTAYLADYLILDYRNRILDIEWHSFAQYSAFEVWGFILFSFLYTYVNFSGFSDIAIGISRIFGFSIVENFNAPLLARNLQDFWKRWHISLGIWISKYVYFPIIAKQKSKFSPYLATLISFFLIGCWHAINANYIIWGLLHGIGLCIVIYWQRLMKKNKPKVLKNNTFKIIYIFLSWSTTLVFVAWVQTFANQKDLSNAIVMTRTMLGF